MAHVLHFILVAAKSAKDAVEEVRPILEDFGTSDNWFQIGDVISEDGRDTIRAFDKDARFSDLALTFSDAVEQVRRELHNIDIPTLLTQAKQAQEKATPDAYRHAADCLHLVSQIQLAIYEDESSGIPEWNSYEFDKFGLTDVTPFDYEPTQGQKYIVMVDMHC